MSEEKSLSPLQHRLIGLGMTVVGLIWVGITMGYTISQAKQGVPELTIHERITEIGLVFLALGIVYSIVGERAVSIFDKMDQSISSIKLYEWFFFIVVVVATDAVTVRPLYFCGGNDNSLQTSSKSEGVLTTNVTSR